MCINQAGGWWKWTAELIVHVMASSLSLVKSQTNHIRANNVLANACKERQEIKGKMEALKYWWTKKNRDGYGHYTFK